MEKLYFAIITLFFCSTNAQIIVFPDLNFKTRLLAPDVGLGPDQQVLTIDTNNNGEIEISEAQVVYGMNVSNSNISDLTGISYFTGLKVLKCANNQLTTLAIDNAISLVHLDASHNEISTLSLNPNAVVYEGLNLSYNNLTSFTATSGQYYEMYNLSHNQLTNLTIDNAHFYYFDISYNNLSEINIIGDASSYFNANFRNNHFSLLNLSHFGFDNQSWVYLGNNTTDTVHFGVQPGNIEYSSNNTFFDLGNFSMTTSCQPEYQGYVGISDCPNLEYLVLKNGFNHTVTTCDEGGDIFDNPALDLYINNCPNLSFICADELENPNIQTRINQLGLQFQVQVNSYCSFTPGGINYTLGGTTRFDYNGNGCDTGNFYVPNQEFTVDNGSESGTVISNASGNYSLGVAPGTYSITPTVENPAIFTISPASLTVNFPGDASPFLQNFCMTAAGVHPDLDISLVPTNSARPGFDAKYKLVYKNKGNQVQSGTINLVFNDAILDFVSANPTTAAQTTNTLTWNFSNLLPFESRAITVSLNINTPTEMPAVNNGDVLVYEASITSTQTDEKPTDNTASLNQTIVNSLDPNDKTCLEGAIITPDMIGKEVHYVIRFENTGTANATTIVIKDLIDASKFDVSTLMPLHGSHLFETRIAGNKAEFIFENINLPFDDASNDGYVSFKIKTKPNLVVGNSFSNTASIYFDYNFPIVTDPAVTTISALETSDLEFSNHFTLWPNPVKNTLNISTKNNIAIGSISIYNMLGQLVQVLTDASAANIVDVSSLKTGNYLIKVNSDKGISSSVFIKQ